LENLSQLEEIEQQYDHLAATGAYAEALALVTRSAHLFPDYAQKVVFSWRISMASKLNDQAQALLLLSEAVQAGYWYSGLRTDPNYQILHDLPEFERLVDLCEERRLQAMLSAEPVIKSYPPSQSQPPYPLLLALHGANATAEVSHWSAGLAHGWFLGLPQSSQIFAPGTYTWNDWDWALQEVPQRFSSLCAEFPIDPQHVVLAGFSQGGGLAAWLALSRRIMVRGVVLVSPFLPDVSHLVPLLESNPSSGLRAYLVAGQRDGYCLEVALALAELLPCYGIACKLDIYADLEHAFPVDFEPKLPEALDFVMIEGKFARET
jgi:predicted esterase